MLPSRIPMISPFVNQLMRFNVRFGTHDGTELNIEIALYEALANSIVHRNQENPRELVCVACRWATKGEVPITVQEEGLSFDAPAVPDPTTPEAYKSTMQAAAKLRDKLRTELTNLVTKMIETWDEVPLALQLMAGPDALYGYVGMDDDTLYPFVRPGAFVRIDPRQKKIASSGWHSDYDRPVYFVELREHYICTWCEMLDGRLILVPSQQSKRRRQHLRYPAEATIVGRVNSITQDIIELPPHEARA